MEIKKYFTIPKTFTFSSLVPLGILYIIIGLLFAIIYAIFYHWSAFTLFSPGFYIVAFSWPIQLPGFILDFQLYGVAGKQLFQ